MSIRMHGIDLTFDASRSAEEAAFDVNERAVELPALSEERGWEGWFESALSEREPPKVEVRAVLASEAVVASTGQVVAGEVALAAPAAQAETGAREIDVELELAPPVWSEEVARIELGAPDDGALELDLVARAAPQDERASPSAEERDPASTNPLRAALEEGVAVELSPARAVDSEPSVEARVPTRLVPGPSRRAPHDGRFAGYALVRELVRAPGAVLAEARDSLGAPWLLQLVRTRAVLDDAERLSRQHLEHVVAARTAELLDEPALGLRAHGVVDEPDGTRTLFWVLPWHPRAPRLAADFSPRPSLDAVLRAALMLARRVTARHAKGRVEPLMSDALLSLGDESLGPALLGFPVLVPPVAAADTMVSPLLAPEERLHAQPTASGDLWRLGEVLRRLDDGIGAPSPALTAVIRGLTEPDPARRTPRAAQALAELEAIVAATTEPAGTTRLSAMDPGALSALMLEASADATTVEPAAGPAATRLVDLSTAERALEEAVGLAAEALASTPSPAPARAAAPAPSAASVALAPFAPDLRGPADTVCEVPTRLRVETDGDEGPALRTVVRTRARPVIERQSGEARVLDRTRRTPEPELERPRVEPVVLEPARLDGDDTQRIELPRPSAVVLRGEVIRDEPAVPMPQSARSGAVARSLRTTHSYVLILLATGGVALALGVALGLAIPR